MRRIISKFGENGSTIVHYNKNNFKKQIESNWNRFLVAFKTSSICFRPQTLWSEYCSQLVGVLYLEITLDISSFKNNVFSNIYVSAPNGILWSGDKQFPIDGAQVFR